RIAPTVAAQLVAARRVLPFLLGRKAPPLGAAVVVGGAPRDSHDGELGAAGGVGDPRRRPDGQLGVAGRELAPGHFVRLYEIGRGWRHALAAGPKPALAVWGIGGHAER